MAESEPYVMIPGTTSTVVFGIPSEIVAVAQSYQIDWVTDSQVVCTKSGSDITVSGNEITTQLTAHETLVFPSNHYYLMQVSVKCTDGTVKRSDPISAYTGYCLSAQDV